MLEEMIDRDGNVTSFFYNENSVGLGNNSSWYPLDSIKTSTNQVIRFFYHNTFVSGYMLAVTLLDSIKYDGFEENTQKISFCYEYDYTATTPWGSNFRGDWGEWDGGNDPDVLDKATFLLKKVVYPNGDSILYDYNDYYELVQIQNPQGGETFYEIKTDTFYVPNADEFPPGGDHGTIMQRTRGITKVKAYDPWSTPDTSITTYDRIKNEHELMEAVSNADSVTVTDPAGNYQIYAFRASWMDYTADDDVVQWQWDNGVLDSTVFYDKDDNFLKKERSFYDTTATTHIYVPQYTRTTDAEKTYETRYYKYDNHGHARLIWQRGDISTTNDDVWIHRKYATGDDDYFTFWMHLTAESDEPYKGSSTTTFYSKVGIDTLIIKRHWQPSETVIADTIVYYPPSHGASVGKPLSAEDNFANVYTLACESGTSEELACTVGIYIGYLDDRGEYDEDFAGINHYQEGYTYLIHLMTEEYISSAINTSHPDSVGTDTLARTRFFYDDTGHVVTKYLTKATQWEEPDLPWLRGRLTRVENWKYGTDFTCAELRYDETGNIVQAISHPDAYEAETTFTYYAVTGDPDKYEYAFPWRVVNHLETAVDSLAIRSEYDISTGLVVKAFDANGDSIVTDYDDYGRLTAVYPPNLSNPTKKITYFTYDGTFSKPTAVLDSTKLDDLSGGRWMVSKRFIDGFGRTIQSKVFDYDNNRTIVSSISYNESGQPDSAANPYELNGTNNVDYSTPSWSGLDITRYEYGGYHRVTKIIHPDGEYARFAYYAHIDTAFDEKGNKTIAIHGMNDTLINALGDTTLIARDRLGRVFLIRDAEGKVTNYYYDLLGRVIGVNVPDVESPYLWDVVNEYNDIGQLTLKKNAHGWVAMEYDDIGRQVLVRFSSNSGSTWPDTIRYTYDVAYSPPSPPSLYNNPKGRLSKVVTVGTDSTIYYYDDQGKVTMRSVGIVGLEGIKYLKYYYNDAGACTTLWATGVGYLGNYNYNRMGQLEEIDGGFIDGIEYNPAGQITEIDCGHAVFDEYEYDSRLRPTLAHCYNTRPAWGDYFRLQYVYEANSNVDSLKDLLDANKTMDFTYDALNQLTAVTSSAGNQSFTYDNVGNRLSKNGSNYTYESGTNRLTKDHRNYEYDYDSLGNIVQRYTQSGTVDTFTYDWRDRLTQYENIQTNEELDFAYNASGLRVKKQFTSSEKAEKTDQGYLFYDDLDDLITSSKDSDTLFDKGRDIEKVYARADGQYVTFTVQFPELRDASKTRLLITLDTDGILNSGKRIFPEDDMIMVQDKCAWEYCLYVQGAEYGLYTQTGARTTYPFGMAVNTTAGEHGTIQIKLMTSLINNPQSVRFTVATYAPENISYQRVLTNERRTTVVDIFPGSDHPFTDEIHGYGELSLTGDRPGQQSSDYTIYYVYNGINPTIEYEPDGDVLVWYLYAGGRHIARIAGEDTTWYHCDVLGSPRSMTDESGREVWNARYYPFGEMTTSGNAENTHGFTGKEWDDEMNLNYVCMRYYDPEIGRFMSRDLIDKPVYSTYAYCYNNPLNYIDPLGLDPIEAYLTLRWHDRGEEWWLWQWMLNLYCIDWLPGIPKPGFGRDLDDYGTVTPAPLEPVVSASDWANFDSGVYGSDFGGGTSYGSGTSYGGGYASSGGSYSGGRSSSSRRVDPHIYSLNPPILNPFSFDFYKSQTVPSRPFQISIYDYRTGQRYEGGGPSVAGWSLDLYFTISGPNLAPPSFEFDVGLGRFLGVGIAWSESSWAFACHAGLCWPPSFFSSSSVWREEGQ